MNCEYSLCLLKKKINKLTTTRDLDGWSSYGIYFMLWKVKAILQERKQEQLTNVTSLEAAAALMCSDGCLTEDEQSRARAKVPTDRDITRNWSICRSVRPCDGVHIKLSNSSILRPSLSPVKHLQTINESKQNCKAREQGPWKEGT